MLKKEILGYHARHYTYGKKKTTKITLNTLTPYVRYIGGSIILLLITDG